MSNNRSTLKFIASLLLLGFLSACMQGVTHHDISRDGFSFRIPDTWGEVKVPKEKGPEDGGVLVSRLVTNTSFLVGKLPKNPESLLLVYREEMARPGSKTVEEKITTFGHFHGEGFKFIRNGGDDERIIFFPKEQLEGWYFGGVVANYDSSARREFDSIIESLKIEVPKK